MQSISETIEYWMEEADKELNCFGDKTKVFELFKQVTDLGIARWMELPDRKGIVACTVSDDFRGRLCVSELFMFIKKEHRGNLRLFKKLIDFMEQIARDNNCVSVKIGSNIGYNDDSVIKCLQRFGYKTDTVIKEIG